MQVQLDQLHLSEIIAAIGGLGTAAFGLMEAIKPVFPFINRIGFGGIRTAVSALVPPESGAKSPVNSLNAAGILNTIEANWVNGNDLAAQKAIAKSLIKLHLSAGNAAAVAAATNVDPAELTAVATSIAAGTPLTQDQADTWARFDLIVTAILDHQYQCGDVTYRNWMRFFAGCVAVVLAVTGGYTMHGSSDGYFLSVDFGRALLVGLLAVPMAPIAKDLTSALATAVNTLQVVKKP